MREAGDSDGAGTDEAGEVVRVRDALGRLHRQLTATVGASAADHERVCELLVSAATEINQNLSTLEALTETQRRQTEAAVEMLKTISGISEIDDDRGFLQFLSRARKIVTDLTEVVSEFSKENVKVTFAVEDLVAELRRVFEDVTRVDEIADDTSMLAINAALEAARAGEAGKGFGVVSSEVRKLSHHTKQLNERITEKVERAETLVADVQRAVEKMAQRDFGVDRMVVFDEEVTDFLETICDLHGHVSAVLAKLDELSRTVDLRVSDAIRLLQFEDIVTQITRAAVARTNIFVDALGAALDEAPAAGSSAALVEAVVTSLERRLESEEIHMPAEQDSLQEGKALLF